MVFNIKNMLSYGIGIFLLTIIGFYYVENRQLKVDNENLKSVVIGMNTLHLKEIEDNKDRLKRYSVKSDSISKTLTEKTKLLKEAKDALKNTCEDSYRLLDSSGI